MKYLAKIQPYQAFSDFGPYFVSAGFLRAHLLTHALGHISFLRGFCRRICWPSGFFKVFRVVFYGFTPKVCSPYVLGRVVFPRNVYAVFGWRGLTFDSVFMHSVIFLLEFG